MKNEVRIFSIRRDISQFNGTMAMEKPHWKEYHKN